MNGGQWQKYHFKIVKLVQIQDAIKSTLQMTLYSYQTGCTKWFSLCKQHH